MQIQSGNTNSSKSPNDFCKAHSISRAMFQRQIAAGKLEGCKIGRRTMVTSDAEHACLEALPKAGKGARLCSTMTTLFAVIETPLFSKLGPDYWTEIERAEFAVYLAKNPDAGDVIAGTGGCRKVRWNLSGTGKSGGARVIYLFCLGKTNQTKLVNRLAEGCLVLLMMYAKSALDTIAADILRKIAKAFGNATQ